MLGNRKYFMWILGFSWVFIGIIYLFSDFEYYDFMHPIVRGLFWIIPGLLGIFTSYSNKLSVISLMLMSFSLIARTGSYIIAVSDGKSQYIILLIHNILLLVLVYTISSVPLTHYKRSKNTKTKQQHLEIDKLLKKAEDTAERIKNTPNPNSQ